MEADHTTNLEAGGGVCSNGGPIRNFCYHGFWLTSDRRCIAQVSRLA